MQNFNGGASSRIERPFSLVHVPSKGKYYENGKSSFLVRHLSYLEENVLSNPDLMESEAGLKMVLENLMVDDFNVEDLLAGDVQAISMFLYSTAYGDKLAIDVTCPVCSFEDKKEIRISDFKIKEITSWPDETRRLYGELPVSKWKFVMTIPKFFEEFRVKNAGDGHEAFMNKLSFMIKELNGTSVPEQMREYIAGMPIKDSRFLREFIKEHTPGVDTNMEHVCQECQESFKTHVASGYNFLQLPEGYANSILEEVYLVVKHSDGIGWDSAIKMSTSQRKWVLTRIQKDNKAKQEHEERESARAKSRTRTFRS